MLLTFEKTILKGDVKNMRNRLVRFLLALVMMLTLLPVTPAFAVSDARAQALAYQKHSLGLTGVPNARDMGGYRTKDGRTIKFGKLFRTGELTDMTAADKKKLVRKYHLVKDIDFRSARNILTDGEDPELDGVAYSRYPYSSMKNLLFTTEGIDIGTDLLEEIIREDYRGDLLSTYFMEGYRQMYLTTDGIEMFRGFFKELLDADGGAVLWHCVSGKDRTGNATMLLLTVLGVEKETIIQDFLLTNDYTRADQKKTYDRVLSLTGSTRIAKDIASKDGVERRWIEASYQTIETYYGSVDNFLKTMVGLSSKDIKKLQKAYLTPAK